MFTISIGDCFNLLIENCCLSSGDTCENDFATIKFVLSVEAVGTWPSAVNIREYTKEISIDGLDGYEIYAKGKDKKTNEIENMYQIMLYSEQFYYIFFGTTNDETTSSIEEIKKAVLTFKRK